tara:strand:+ start:2583 stop:3236 length:654 start_codon:yes stop_codon:yes gene_type:complete
MQDQEKFSFIPKNRSSIKTRFNSLKPEGVTDKLFILKNSQSTLWERLKSGDRVALGEIYNQYIDLLFSFGISQTNDKGHVMDCIHDLFVDLFKYRKNLAKTDNIKYYLFKSLKRKINRKYSGKIIPISMELKGSFNDHIKNHTKSHEENIISKENSSERSARLSTALNSLTTKQREGLFLRFNKEKSYKEISLIMKVSIQTSRTTIYRAIKTLRKHI